MTDAYHKIIKAYSVEMAFSVSDAEKKEAQHALLAFKSTSHLLSQASDYLNVMKTPFKDNPEMSPDDVMKARPVIRRFRDSAVDNFSSFKKAAFECVNLMKTFASDTQTLKLMKSFIISIDELEAQVNAFADLFNDLESKDFPKNIVVQIEDIQSKCDDLEETIDERIRTHVQSNILATNWVDAVSTDLQTKVEKKTPLILDLYNQRTEQLNDTIKERSTVGN
jgi:hypothetical protein